MKQTAVEWFYQRILAKDIKEVFEQAKLIEIDQMRAIYAMTWMNRDFDFEQYIKDNKNNVTTK